MQTKFDIGKQWRGVLASYDALDYSVFIFTRNTIATSLSFPCSKYNLKTLGLFMRKHLTK